MTLMIADDHVTVRAGIRALLLATPAFAGSRIEEISSLDQVASSLESRSPDLLILDLQWRQTSALDLMPDWRARFPSVPILIHSLHQEGLLVVRALALGARGFVNKESPEASLPEAAAAVIRGEVYLDKTSLSALAEGLSQVAFEALSPHTGDTLTYREREVYRHLAEGENTKTIALLLKISPKTVDNHRSSILSKLGLATPAELVRHAHESRLLP